MTGGRMAAVGAVLMTAVLVADIALANPFGVARPEASVAVATGPFAELFGWISARQAAFYRELTGLIANLRTEPAAGWVLVALSFLYGVLHAAGPGHGKVIITSYLVATRQTMRRGVMLSFASAVAQALTAIALVALLTIALKATSMAMNRATGLIEIASYALITLIGLRLVWLKGSALAARLPVVSPIRAATAGGPPVGHPGHGAHHHGHDHQHHDHERQACGCSHAHSPDPATLGGRLTLSSAWTAVLAVGLRPCSGALIVLVFAFSQGLFWVGVVATLAMAVGTGLAVALLAGLAVGARGLAARLAAGGGAAGSWALAGVQTLELLAALAVLAFGTLLLGGALSAGL
ncbi:ABC-type nickel/cobalt efflux system permease component RcnA [Tepidamorphus gemmatus]|uniref:Nickel/cobalt efflux system n=1 Tax=Tepidamorphus gemmatus TaxID=747076 RepID=A0A4R3MIQ8_9HYPH|nr:nickel/cobalt transporter [Tepidamorphus gemmatus]TCT13234.1 ABC-type nickel/cobalt efflux system permease component RcnA [Tepidamorphus gemmatus]